MFIVVVVIVVRTRSSMIIDSLTKKEPFSLTISPRKQRRFGTGHRGHHGSRPTHAAGGGGRGRGEVSVNPMGGGRGRRLPSDLVDSHGRNGHEMEEDLKMCARLLSVLH